MLKPGKSYTNTNIELTANFHDETNVDVDPAGVILKTMSPCGVQKTYTYGVDSNIGRLDTGDYFADVIPNEPGRWHFRWETTGANTTLTYEGSFVVQFSPFTEGVRDAYRT